MHNPNCDGAHCTRAEDQVRVLPTGGEGNAILCHACYCYEIAYRRQRNADETGAQFDLPKWRELKVYDTK